MTDSKKRLEFYSTERDELITLRGGRVLEAVDFRWRLSTVNGRKGCNPGEGYDRPRDAKLAAIAWLGIAQRSDVVVPDKRDRLALARLLHKQHPEVSERAWEWQLDPESQSRFIPVEVEQ